jgi:hypothetical protein
MTDARPKPQVTSPDEFSAPTGLVPRTPAQHARTSFRHPQARKSPDPSTRALRLGRVPTQPRFLAAFFFAAFFFAAFFAAFFVAFFFAPFFFAPFFVAFFFAAFFVTFLAGGTGTTFLREHPLKGSSKLRPRSVREGGKPRALRD